MLKPLLLCFTLRISMRKKTKNHHHLCRFVCSFIKKLLLAQSPFSLSACSTCPHSFVLFIIVVSFLLWDFIIKLEITLVWAIRKWRNLMVSCLFENCAFDLTLYLTNLKKENVLNSVMAQIATKNFEAIHCLFHVVPSENFENVRLLSSLFYFLACWYYWKWLGLLLQSSVCSVSLRLLFRSIISFPCDMGKVCEHFSNLGILEQDDRWIYENRV